MSLPDRSQLIERLGPNVFSRPHPVEEPPDIFKPPCKKPKRKKVVEPPLETLLKDLSKRKIVIYREAMPKNSRLPDMILRRPDSSIMVDLRFVDYLPSSKEGRWMKETYEQPGKKLVMVEESQFANAYNRQLRRILAAFDESKSAAQIARPKVLRLPSKSKRAR